MNLKNISGSFRTKPNGTIEYRTYIDGKQKSFYGKNEAECLKKCREYMINYNREKEREYAKSNHMTLSEYIEYWLLTYKFGSVANSTYDRLECALNVHIKGSDLGNKEIFDITSDDVQEFINSKKITMSLSSLKKIKEVLSPCFNHATASKMIKSNPMDLVVFPRNDKSLPIKTKVIECYNDKEIEKIAKTSTYPYYKANARRYRYAPMFTFILNTGLRFGECLALTWDDINFENNTISVNKTLSTIKNRNKDSRSKKIQIISDPKTYNSTRILPMNKVAKDMLLEMKVRNSLSKIESNIVFTNYVGEHINMRSVQETFVSICKDIGIEHKGIHALRHTFGSVLVRNKVDIKVVSELLGHTDVKFTYNRYIHIINEQKAEAMNILNITPIVTENLRYYAQG